MVGETGEEWAHVSANVHLNIFEKLIQNFNWTGIIFKSGKRLGIARKAARPYKSSITFWAKVASRPKNKQTCAAVTQSVDPQYYFKNCFFYEANFSLINYLKSP